jgi:hypothetical protein
MEDDVYYQRVSSNFKKSENNHEYSTNAPASLFPYTAIF